MRITLLLVFSLIVLSTNAQKNLWDSRNSSALTYIYSLTADEAAILAKKKQRRIADKYLHTKTDSFPTDSAKPQLAQGNYLFVKAIENKLQYELVSVGDLQFKVLTNNHDLAVLLHERNGSIIKDALVYRGRKKLAYDNETQYHLIKNTRRKGRLKAIHKNVVYFAQLDSEVGRSYYGGSYRRSLGYKIKNTFPIRNITSWIYRLRNPDYNYRSFFNEQTKYEKHFTGYIAFNKPIYRPGDTVYLKAFVTTKSGKPVTRPLLLRLSDDGLLTDSILATIRPYRAGAYEYSFKLSDSLDLTLDDRYLLTLEETRSAKIDLDDYDGNLDEEEYALKRKVVLRGKFEYEEYELKSVKFTARADKTSSYTGEKNIIYLKATDENNLPVLDGRVDITIQSKDDERLHFHQPAVFLADTLFTKTIQLDPIGETRFTIPDSLFPQASFNYVVSCEFLNSNNESRSQSIYLRYENKKEKFLFRLKDDSLLIEHSVGGSISNKQQNIRLVNLSGSSDTIQASNIQLPAAIPLNPWVAKYIALSGSAVDSFELKNDNTLVNASAVRTKDSLHITLENKHRLPAWYSLFAGKKIIKRAAADTTIYLDKTYTKKNYDLSLQYVYGNQVHTKNYNFPFAEKQLLMDIDQPEFVYPGQTAEITINLKDASGKPVASADVTAYAFTSKFENSQDPVIPYYGKRYRPRKSKNQFNAQAVNNQAYTELLDWQRWSKEMQLDSIEYYKFLHPRGVYVNHQDVPGEPTQIAPFVVKNGELQQIHLLYIDEEPVFFSRSQDLSQYSFAVTPGKHAIRIRTSNALIHLDSIYAFGGKKTFFSINPDSSARHLRVVKQRSKLSDHDIALWNKYMILIQSNYGENMVYLRQQDRIMHIGMPTANNAWKSMLAVGPLKSRGAELVVKTQFVQPFEVETDYQYTITEGLIKQKQLANPVIQKKFRLYGGTMQPHFRDLVLTEKEIDRLWQKYLFERSRNQSLFSFRELDKTGNGNLRFSIDPASLMSEDSIKQVILFKSDNADFIRIYTGLARNLQYLVPGNYRLLLLYANDDYVIRDSLNVQRNGINFYRFNIGRTKKKDSISAGITEIINNKKIQQYNQGSEGLAEVRDAFNAVYLDPTTFTRQVSGYVYDEKGKPIVGASINIATSRIGTVTDQTGYFNMATPQECRLVISAVGYTSVEAYAANSIVLNLKPATYELQDVVVVGYGVQRKRNETAAASTIVTQGPLYTLAGRVSGITVTEGNPRIAIRGTSSFKNGSPPLIIIDGIPFTGKMEDLDINKLGEVFILKGDQAVSIYGARAANGAIIIGSVKKTGEAEEPLPDARNSIRRNFRDHAYWQPRLSTDKNGSASFKVTFPDDITNWKTYAIAMADQKKTGFSTGNIRSFKTLSGILSLPNFLTEGDSINIIAKTQNYLGDTINVNRVFRINDSIVSKEDFTLRDAKIDTFSIIVSNTDSLAFSYTIQKPDGYADGELRNLGVTRAGVNETNGLFAALDKDTSFTLQTDPTKGEITIYAETGAIPVLLEEIARIDHYEYYCNEQIASKLKALLLQKRIYTQLNTAFKGNNQVNDLIRRLEKARRSDGGWGWWPNTEPVSWISMHVLEALVLANEEGFKNTINKQVQIDQLVQQLPLAADAQKLASLRILKVLDAKFNYEPLLDSLHKYRYRLSLNDQLDLMLMRQQAGLAIKLDSAYNTHSKTLMGNMYWGSEGYQILNNSIQRTIKMYKLLRNSGSYDRELSKIRNYFFEKRRSNSWRNTYESSLIIETLLPDLIKEVDPKAKPVLTIMTQDTDASRKDSIVITSFPYHVKQPASTAISISKKGIAPVYFTSYQQSWNSKPLKVDSIFAVSSVFIKNEQSLTTLTAGQAVTLKVEVNVTADGDYVMIEIPIPAGCSYDSKPQSWRYNEVHREYFKNKVSIFCSALNKGKYVFDVPLMPRFTGKFNLNPAKAELMYFPVFYGREGMKGVEIK